MQIHKLYHIHSDPFLLFFNSNKLISKPEVLTPLLLNPFHLSYPHLFLAKHPSFHFDSQGLVIFDMRAVCL